MRKAKDAVLPQAIKQAIKARTLYGALLLLLLAAPVAAEQSLTAFQCGLYNNSFKQNRKQLQEQKDAEKDACSQKIDQINNTFAWFKHCEADINDRYRPAFQKLDAEEKQFMDKAQNCKAIADQKLKDQERLAKQQQETNRIVEQQQQALRTEQFNRELERSNAERDAYNQRAQADANRQAAQYQAQQRAQQAAAQAEYQRQQAARQAAAEAEQRRQQEWQQTVDTTTEWVRSSRQSNEMQLANAQAKTQQIETAYGQEDDALARMIAEAKARQERAAQEAKTARTPDVNPSESEDQVQTSSPECAAREQEVKATRIPSNASITASQETVMFLTQTAVEMFDDGCPGISADERRQYQAAYDAAQQGCNQVQSGGRQCVASNHFGPGAKPGEGLRSPVR